METNRQESARLHTAAKQMYRSEKRKWKELRVDKFEYLAAPKDIKKMYSRVKEKKDGLHAR